MITLLLLMMAMAIIIGMFLLVVALFGAIAMAAAPIVLVIIADLAVAGFVVYKIIKHIINKKKEKEVKLVEGES